MEMAASHGEGKFSLVPVYLSIATVSLLMNAVLQQNAENVIPFTAQEWMWAVRDGYLDTVVFAFLKSGGHVIDSDMMSKMDTESLQAMSFTSQEWWWAMRDGYLDDMVASSVRNWGLSQMTWFKP